MKLRRCTALLLTILVGLFAHATCAMHTPLPTADHALVESFSVEPSASDFLLIQAVHSLGQSDDGMHIDLVVCVNPKTLTPVFCTVQSPLGLEVNAKLTISRQDRNGL